MNHEDAYRIVVWMNSAFRREALDEAATSVYAAEVALLADRAVAADAARKAVRESDRLPTIHEFRRLYRAVNEQRQQQIPRLPEPPRSKIPTWVHVWCWCQWGREPREQRSFPQQNVEDALADPPFLTFDDYQRLEDEWQRAGQPKLIRSAADLVAAATPSAI